MIANDIKKYQEWRQNNTDPYGEAIFVYAEQWADIMEKQIAEGKELKDIWKKASNDADTNGITGFMYGASVSILSQCWQYGEELRRLHNLDVQIKNEGEKANEEGGVLNHALLRLG